MKVNAFSSFKFIFCGFFYPRAKNVNGCVGPAENILVINAKIACVSQCHSKQGMNATEKTIENELFCCWRFFVCAAGANNFVYKRRRIFVAGFSMLHCWLLFFIYFHIVCECFSNFIIFIRRSLYVLCLAGAAFVGVKCIMFSQSDAIFFSVVSFISTLRWIGVTVNLDSQGFGSVANNSVRHVFFSLSLICARFRLHFCFRRAASRSERLTKYDWLQTKSKHIAFLWTRSKHCYLINIFNVMCLYLCICIVGLLFFTSAQLILVMKTINIWNVT